MTTEPIIGPSLSSNVNSTPTSSAGVSGTAEKNGRALASAPGTSPHWPDATMTRSAVSVTTMFAFSNERLAAS
ncbi:MAG: hypothetical protein U0414_06235 [Polyangiaceae bacterium]